MRVVLVAATVLLSLGSASAKTSPEKQAVMGWIQQNFRDPSSIRGAKITDPVPYSGGTLVCVELNAKNGYGGYTGRERHPFVIRAGQAIGPNEYRRNGVNVTTSTCEGALPLNWRAFPELERL